MFTKEKNSGTPERNSNNATLISSGSELQGDLKSDHDLRIDGTIYGNVITKAKVVIGPSGYVEGNIEAVQADIMGKVTGNILAEELLQLRGQSNIQGNVTAGKLQIEPSAIFNGQCKMGEALLLKQVKNVTTEKAELYQ